MADLAQGIKSLHDKLGATRRTLAPKSKFAFKSSRKKNDSAVSIDDAAELFMQQRDNLSKTTKGPLPSTSSSSALTPATSSTPPDDRTSDSQEWRRSESLGSFLKAAGVDSNASQSSSSVQKISFSAADSAEISSHSASHIVISPFSSFANPSGSLTDLRGCIVDMSIRSATDYSFAGLAIKNVRQSLLICGNVNGAVHITGVDQSVLVVSTRQYRMHECNDCIVYLYVSSKPVIEDCHGIQFAPLPLNYVSVLQAASCLEV